MEVLHQAIDLFLHLDKHLNDAMLQHGTVWTYGVLFLIIFCETGLVVTRMQHTESMPVVRRLANWLTLWITSKLAREWIPDSLCGYRLLCRGCCRI